MRKSFATYFLLLGLTLLSGLNLLHARNLTDLPAKEQVSSLQISQSATAQASSLANRNTVNYYKNQYLIPASEEEIDFEAMEVQKEEEWISSKKFTNHGSQEITKLFYLLFADFLFEQEKQQLPPIGYHALSSSKKPVYLTFCVFRL